MLDRILRAIAIAIGIAVVGGVLFCIGYWLLFIAILDDFAKKQTKYSDNAISDLKENFEKNKKEIYELKAYYNEIVPKDRYVTIQFGFDTTVAELEIGKIDSAYVILYRKTQDELRYDSPVKDSIITSLGWTRKTLKTIQEKMVKAQCWEIRNGEPSILGYSGTESCTYSFLVFDKPISSNIMGLLTDSCKYYLANERLMLEYRCDDGLQGPGCLYLSKNK